MKTSGLKNVNILTKAQYDGVVEPADDELWAVEIETYSDNNGNWYRIYPDGWCEQGGRRNSIATDSTVTLTLLKPFRDTNYTFMEKTIQTGAPGGNARSGSMIYSYTASSVTLQQDTYQDSGGMWCAYGFIK